MDENLFWHDILDVEPERNQEGTHATADDAVPVLPDDIESTDMEDLCTVEEYFVDLPEMAKPLLRNAKAAFTKIQQMLLSTPSFVNAVKASIPKETLQAVLSDEQKSKLANGAVKLMTRKKDGAMLAVLVDSSTDQIVSQVPLERVQITPEITQAITSFSMQIQLAQIAEQIQQVQAAVEEVRQGQESDRLATAYSCQQKLLQVMAMKNPEYRAMALWRIAADAEDSRNLLMQSQNANIAYLKSQPESLWGKLCYGDTPKKIHARLQEIRDSLYAINMVSLAEAIAYQEMGETESAQRSLQYYAEYIQTTFLEPEGLVERLDLIDPSPEQYWSKMLPDIEKKIHALPVQIEEKLLEGKDEKNDV